MNLDRITATLDSAIEQGLTGVIAGATSPTQTTFLQARGVRRVPEPELVTTDATFALYSASKPITATAALQCVEDGVLDLDTPAGEYLPAIDDLEVLVELTPDGRAVTRPPRRRITVRMLLLHTSGIGYDIFDPQLAAISRTNRPATARESLAMPLLHDPGDTWTYGMSIDWLGLVVQAVRNQRLNDVMRERIFDPCGMTSTSFDMPQVMRERLMPAHRRRPDGSISASRADVPEHAELDMGGQGLFSTTSDYLAFLRVWLGDGSAPFGRVLREDTVSWAVQAAPGIAPTGLQSAISALSSSIEFYPGVPKSWAYSFLRVDADIAGMRRAGTLSWAGLANVHFWIDRTSGIAAMWSAQLMPWQDPVVAQALEEFERAIYSP